MMTRTGKILGLAVVFSCAAFLLSGSKPLSGWIERHMCGCSGRFSRDLAERGIVAYWDFDDRTIAERIAGAGNISGGTRLVQGRYRLG